MNREKAIKKIYIDYVANEEDCSEFMNVDNVYSLINKIYDDFEKDLKDIHNQVSRLKKQLANNHHIKCMCSFCKPVDNIGNNELEEHIKNKMKALIDKSIIDDIDYVSGDGNKNAK